MFSELFTPQNPLILASESPQRIRILEMLEIPFRAVPSNLEEILDPALTPEKNAEALAEQKAESVFLELQKNPLNPPEKGDLYVVGVDTLVVSAQGKILGKPQDTEEARVMMREASGQTETIISGICLISPHGKWVDHEVAKVRFFELTKDDIDRIIATEEWQNVSGGIRVSGKTGMYIEEISGNFWNIVGFPIPTFRKILAKLKQNSK